MPQIALILVVIFGWLRGHKILFTLLFLAENKEEVQACYEAGLEAGGRDNGAPGYRSEQPIYYAAFMIDPDGNNIEVVCHKE